MCQRILLTMDGMRVYLSRIMNNCPRCQSPVTSSPQCPQCGLDLSLPRAVDNLELEISQVRRSMVESLSRLDGKVSAVRRECVAALNQIPQREVPVVEKTAAVETSAPAVEIATNSEVVAAVPPALPKMSTVAQPVASTQREDAWEKIPGMGAFSEAQLGQKWLLIIGVVVLVLGIGYFLKYSFEQNWVQPPVRVAMAYAVGATLLGLGEWFRRRHENFGLCLAGGGIATLYFSTFAGYEIYHLLPSVVAFGLMIVVTALAGLLSLKYDSKWLSVLGLVGGFITPVVINTGSQNHIALFTYFTVLNAGVLGIAFYKQWRLLNYLGFFFTWSFYCAWGIGNPFSSSSVARDHFWSGLFFANLFYLIYAVTPFGRLLRGEKPQSLQGFGLSVPNSVLGFCWSYYFIEEHWSSEMTSVIALAYAALQLGLAQLVWTRNPENRNAMLISLAKSLFFMALTVPILASNHWITIFWAMQACLVLWVAQRVRSGWMFVGAVILSVLVAGKLFFFDYDRADYIVESFSFRNGYSEYLFDRLLAAAFVLGSFGLSGWLLQKEKEPFFDGQKDWSAFYYSAFGVMLFVVLNMEVGGFFYNYARSAQFASISVLWALFSVAMMGLGFLRRISVLRYAAMALFVVTIAKVFFFDMANVSTPFRIVSFMVLGLMMIGASFLYYKFRDRLFMDNGEEK